MLRLIEPDAGSIHFEGRDLLGLNARELRAFRRDAQIIFQDPYASLNPRMTVSQILAEPLALHDLVPSAQRRERVEELLRLVGLEPRFARRYPHEFPADSANASPSHALWPSKPKLIICDEPVSALDVSIRSQILNLLRDLQDRLGLAYIFVSHDLAVVKHIADRVAVMNLGGMSRPRMRSRCLHCPVIPTAARCYRPFLCLTPKPSADGILLRGEMPSALNPPSGCRFHTRCPYVIERCRVEAPLLLADMAGLAAASPCHGMSSRGPNYRRLTRLFP